jgi:hypothetical protein
MPPAPTVARRHPFVDERTKAEHVGDEDDEPHGIAQDRAFGLGDQLHVQEGL